MNDVPFRYSIPQRWYGGLYHDRAEPCKAGRPFILAHSLRPRRCILVVHGYTGYPGEVVRPARELYALGYDVYAPRLPGHGTSGADFARTGMDDWLGLVLNAVRDLRTRYDEVFIAGHSMGGALAIIASAREGLGKTALLAPAAAPHDARLPIARLTLAGIFSRRKPVPWNNDPGYSMYYEDAPADDMHLGAEYWSWIYFRQLRDLFRLSRSAMDAAAGITGDALLVTAGKDAIIPAGWTDALYAAIPCRKQLVPIAGATHYMLYDKDKEAEEEAVSAVVSFFGP